MDLPQQFLLLATRDRSGRPLGYQQYGFGGAVLAELLLQEAIEVRQGHVRGLQTPQDMLYRPVWEDVRHHPHRPPGFWVRRLSGRRHRLLRHRVAARLVEAGVLRRDERLVGVRYPTVDARPESALQAKVRTVLRGEDVDARLAALVALCAAARATAGLHPVRQTRKEIRRMAKHWVQERPFAKAVHDIVSQNASSVATMTVVGGSVQ